MRLLAGPVVQEHLGVGAWTLLTFLVASRPEDEPRVSQLSLRHEPPPNLGP